MAYDSDSGYMHLTRNGWRRKDEEPWPEDRVETYSYEMHQSSGWSKEKITLTLIWSDPTLTDAERDALYLKAGRPVPDWPDLRLNIERRKRA